MVLATLILIAAYIAIDIYRETRLESRLEDIEDCLMYVYENHPDLLDYIRVD